MSRSVSLGSQRLHLQKGVIADRCHLVGIAPAWARDVVRQKVARAWHDFFALADLNMPHLKYEPWTPITPPRLAGLAVDTWADAEEIRALWSPGERYEPIGAFDRDRWRDAVSRASGWHADLSALDF